MFDIDLEKDLIIERVLNVARPKLWTCWTEAQHIQQFFIPKPYLIQACEIDLKVGGCFNTLFNIDGNLIANQGVYLEIIEGEKLVFTDHFHAGWKPAEQPFMTAIILFEDHFEDHGLDQTKYTAIARHRNVEDRQKHEDMGFYQGWGIVIDQLEDYAKQL